MITETWIIRRYNPSIDLDSICHHDGHDGKGGHNERPPEKWGFPAKIVNCHFVLHIIAVASPRFCVTSFPVRRRRFEYPDVFLVQVSPFAFVSLAQELGMLLLLLIQNMEETMSNLSTSD